jgi:cytochrome b
LMDLVVEEMRRDHTAVVDVLAVASALTVAAVAAAEAVVERKRGRRGGDKT